MTAEETKGLLEKVKEQAGIVANRLNALEKGEIYHFKKVDNEGTSDSTLTFNISPYKGTYTWYGAKFQYDLDLKIIFYYTKNLVLPDKKELEKGLRRINYIKGLIQRLKTIKEKSYTIRVYIESMSPKDSKGEVYDLKGYWIVDGPSKEKTLFRLDWEHPYGKTSVEYYNLLKNPDSDESFLLNNYKNSVQELLDNNKNLKDQKIFSITNAESAEKVIDFVTEQEKVLTKVTTSIEQKVLDPAQLRRTSTTITVLPRSTSSVISNPISQDKIKSDYRKTEELTFDKRLENFQRETYIDRQYSAYSNGLKYDRPCCIRIYESDGRSGYQEPKKLNCFLTQAIQTSLSEKFSLFQSLSGDVLAYFFGKQPVIYRFSVVLYNMYNQQWWHDFRMAFDKTLRGSASIKKNVRTVVSYEDHVLEGFFLEMNSNQSTSNPAIVNADFSLLLLQDTIVGDYKEKDDVNNARGIEWDVIYNPSSENATGNGSIKQADNKKEQIAANNSERMALIPNNTNIIVDESASIKKDSKNSIEKKVAEEITPDKKTIAFKNNNIIEEFVINFSTKGSSSRTEVKNKKDLKETSDEYKKAALAVKNANRSRK